MTTLLHVVPQFIEDQHHTDVTSLNCMKHLVLLFPYVDASSMDDPGAEEGGEDNPVMEVEGEESGNSDQQSEIDTETTGGGEDNPVMEVEGEESGDSDQQSEIDTETTGAGEQTSNGRPSASGITARYIG